MEAVSPASEEEALIDDHGPYSTEGLVAFGDHFLESADLLLVEAVAQHLGGASNDKALALANTLAQCAAKARKFEEREKFYQAESVRLQEVLEYLMNSRREIEARVTTLEEEEIPRITASITEQTELANNVHEECHLIQGELETLTQVLFEEVNQMVSNEARAKHEELQSTQELEEEIARVRGNLREMHARFQALKGRLNSSGKMLKQKSMASLHRGSARRKFKAERRSSQALNEIFGPRE
jgi:archaellum component FlaC